MTGILAMSKERSLTANHLTETTEAVRQCLDNHPQFRQRGDSTRIDNEHGRITLRGRLPTYYLKQLLQESVRHIDGVLAVENLVDVVPDNGQHSSTTND